MCEAVVNKFAANGLNDIKFIGPEVSNPAYGFDQLLATTSLVGKFGFSCHSYDGGMPAWFYTNVKNSVHGNTEVWMGEFGSLSQGTTDDMAKVIFIENILIRSLLNGC